MKNGWKVGDDVYNQTAKGNDPSWSAVRSRFWQNEASAPDAASTYGSENLDRMSKGLAPQRYNADKGGVESMELSHEPIPARDGGKDFVPRWPQESIEERGRGFIFIDIEDDVEKHKARYEDFLKKRQMLSPVTG